MKNILFIFVIFIFGQNICSGQVPQPSENKYVDSIVASMHIKYALDPEELADKITAPFKSDSEKVRAIYYWMTQNIAYDCKAFHSASFSVNADQADFDNKRILKTLSIKKGVCNDYSLVFARLCKYKKIPCEVVTGYALTSKPYNILKIQGDATTNHAWNAVKVNNKWYLLDVTWASGHVDNRVSKFTRKRNDFYYLTPPEDFIRDHHPAESNWQLLDKPLNMKAFIENARYKERDN